MSAAVKADELLDPWPGYSEQSWQERYLELLRRQTEVVERANAGLSQIARLLAEKAATRPDRDQVLEEAAGWQPIETAPKDGTAVLVYFANLEWRDMAGELVTFGALRDHVERTEIGFYQDGTWCESGTAHDMFEIWRDQSELPTHWMPLPTPPSTGAA